MWPNYKITIMKHVYTLIAILFTLTLQAQELISISPDRGNTGATVTVTVTASGTHFTQGSVNVILQMGTAILIADEIRTISDTEVEADIALREIQSPTAPIGHYDVLVTIGTSESYSLPEAFYVDFPVSVEDNSNIEMLSIYPNPALNGQFTLEGTFSKDFEMLIVDMTGKAIHSERIGKLQNRTEVNIAGYSPGTYILILQNNEERIARKLILR